MAHRTVRKARRGGRDENLHEALAEEFGVGGEAETNQAFLHVLGGEDRHAAWLLSDSETGIG